MNRKMIITHLALFSKKIPTLSMTINQYFYYFIKRNYSTLGQINETVLSYQKSSLLSCWIASVFSQGLFDRISCNWNATIISESEPETRSNLFNQLHEQFYLNFCPQLLEISSLCLAERKIIRMPQDWSRLRRYSESKQIRLAATELIKTGKSHITTEMYLGCRVGMCGEGWQKIVIRPYIFEETYSGNDTIKQFWEWSH